MQADILSDIQALLEGKAEGRYGLTFINRQQHALQAAWLAEKEVRAFEALPHSAQAVQLRRYDEQAKVKGMVTPDVAHFMPAVARSLAG